MSDNVRLPRAAKKERPLSLRARRKLALDIFKDIDEFDKAVFSTATGASLQMDRSLWPLGLQREFDHIAAIRKEHPFAMVGQWAIEYLKLRTQIVTRLILPRLPLDQE